MFRKEQRNLYLGDGFVTIAVIFSFRVLLTVVSTQVVEFQVVQHQTLQLYRFFHHCNSFCSRMPCKGYVAFMIPVCGLDLLYVKYCSTDCLQEEILKLIKYVEQNSGNNSHLLITFPQFPIISVHCNYLDFTNAGKQVESGDVLTNDHLQVVILFLISLTEP